MKLRANGRNKPLARFQANGRNRGVIRIDFGLDMASWVEIPINADVLSALRTAMHLSADQQHDASELVSEVIAIESDDLPRL